MSRVTAVLGPLHDVLERAVFDELCAGCVREFAITGAGLTFIVDGRLQGSLGVSDERSRRVEELQFTYGEGPCVDANRSGQPVLEPRLAGASARWPAFTPALEEMADCRAVVHQAGGMISVQLDLNIDEALVALRAHAYQTSTAIGELAADVVARRARLDGPLPSTPHRWVAV